MVEKDFRSISCEIMDMFRSNFGSILLVLPSVRLSTIYSGCLVSATSPTVFGQSF